MTRQRRARTAIASRGGGGVTAGGNGRSVQIGEETYSLGDNILIQGENAVLGQPWVGKIVAFHRQQDRDGTYEAVKVAWYYRPEDCRAGRKRFHAEKEIFASDHLDWVHEATVLGKCRVHVLDDFLDLEDQDESDYFSRFTYNPVKHEFKDHQVQVYCTCEIPYNPDIAMIECKWCSEWFHPDCVGMENELKPDGQFKPFICEACSKKRRRNIGDL